MDAQAIKSLIARERPGWQVVEITEVNDESGPSFTVVVKQGGQRRTLLVREGQILGDRG
jgi:hypothetical protein